MLPPVLEIYVVWHPKDVQGQHIAKELTHHFQHGPYAELLAETVQIYVRSEAWGSDPAGPPRKIPWPAALPRSSGERHLTSPATHVAIVPLIGLELCTAVQRQQAGWIDFLHDIESTSKKDPAHHHLQVLPITLDNLLSRTPRPDLINRCFGSAQSVGTKDGLTDKDKAPPAEDQAADRLLGLVQALAQWLTGSKLQVFISHTKHRSEGAVSSTETEAVAALVNQVRAELARGHAGTFYDAHDLQPGCNWAEELRHHASNSALLVLRTDLYASRYWCQNEVYLAKTNGRPIVVLDALTTGEHRGSFLLDHMPRRAVRPDGAGWNQASIRQAVQQLTDAWLCRALWRRQGEVAAQTAPYNRYTWLPCAPEPTTLLEWLAESSPSASSAPRASLRPHVHSRLLLYPDPPMTGLELEVLCKVMRHVAGHNGSTDDPIELITPQQLAAGPLHGAF